MDSQTLLTVNRLYQASGIRSLNPDRILELLHAIKHSHVTPGGECMDHYDSRFLIDSERRRGEKAVAAQHRMVKEAQRAGMKISPLLSLSNVNIGPLIVALAHGLGWLGNRFAFWSCQLQSRYASVPLGTSPESQSSPCSS